MSEFSEQLIPMSCEAWRHECEVAFLVGLPLAARNDLLEGRPGSKDGDEGIKGARGSDTVGMLRAEIERLIAIRRRRAMGCRQ
ncbi:MAG: hypothetical protein DCF30_09280 [Hyphomicrobiales bacterium]|nr:MAG: hypothetical protein DCF30_09280 [Hyphomicrobiales bacterium]